MAAVVGIVASLVRPAIELGKCIVPPIKREFSYLCCFNSHIKKLKEETKELEAASAGLQTLVDEAKNKGERIVPEVETWLISANNEIQVNRRVIENEVPNVQSGCSTIISRYSLSKKAKKTTDSTKELRDGRSKFAQISVPAPPPAGLPIPLGQTDEFESRKQIEKDIMEALRSKNINIIGICGMGGVGKTTMAKGIMNRVMEEHLFDEVMMTVVGQQVDMLEIQRDISESLRLSLEMETNLFDRARQLHSRLKDRKGILIVVDDIWEILKLEDVGIPCESGVEGYPKVLLTSRDERVLNAMRAQKLYAIDTLHEQEAWFLFEKESGICSDDINLLPTAKDIVKECSGLPLALTIVGSGLKGEKDREIWEGVLQQLRNANPAEVPDVIEKVYKPLKASYELLRSPNAQSLFLLCSLFPEDSNISVKDLTLYCRGLPNFQEIGNLKEATNTVLLAIKLLKTRFLLLDGSGGHHYVKYHYVRMHDVVRDVAIFIASTEGLAYVNPHSRQHNSYSECKWISFFQSKGNQLLPNTLRLNIPSFRILMVHYLFQKKLEIEDFSFLEGMKELIVLSLKSMSFKSVPQSMQLLKNLRTLLLEFCTLETISVVGELLSLEILCFRYCGSFKELPAEIGRLNRLKLLEFSDCAELKTIPPGVLSNLIELEELTMVKSFNKWELAKAKDSRNVNVSLHELQLLLNLTCLNIEIEDFTLAAEDMPFSSDIVTYHIKLGTSLSTNNERPLEKKMHLNLPREITIGNWIHKFAKSTEELRLSGDGSNILDLLQAPNVKSLHLEHCSMVKKLMDTTSIDRWRFDALYLSNLPNLEEICDVPIAWECNSFKNLKELNLVNLPALEHLWNNPNQNISLSNISSIKVSNCGLCSLAIAMDSLSQLQDLWIDSCPMMKQVFLNEGDGKKSHITFPQLKRLTLFGLQSLTTFCQEIGSIEFPMLTGIEIRNCPRITSLVSSIENNQNSASTLLFYSQQVTFGRLRNLKIRGCNHISKIWCHQMPDSFFIGLEELKIVECDSIRSLFSSAIARNLVNLENLSIERCKEMVKVIEDEEEIAGETNCSLLSLFPKLDYLTLDSLPKLESFCGWRCNIELPVLRSLNISGCPMMKVSAMGSGHLECRKLISIESSMDPDGNNDDISPLFCGLKVAFGTLGELCIQGYKKEVRYGMSYDRDKKRYKKDLYIQGYNNISKIWCHQIPDSFFIGLEELKIVDCDSIGSLFSSAIARNLGNLEDLSIQRCKEMVKVIEDEEEITGETNCPLVSLFPKLRSLRLVSLPKLESFCEWRCDLELPILHSLDINGCPMMKVFPMGSLIGAHKLEHIECPKLTSIESLIGPDGNNDDTSPLFCSLKVTFGRLRKLTIGEYNNISKIWCHQMPDSFFTGLEGLTIVECDSIGSLFSSAIARNLIKLEYLKIKDCKEMVKVIENEEEITGETNCPLVSLFPNLQSLRLVSLPKLESFCEWRCDLELPVLFSLKIHGCPMMKVFTMGLGHIECPKLTTIESPMSPDGNNDDISPLFCGLKVTFGRLRELTVGGYNNVSKIWCHQIPNSFFTGLEELKITECDNVRSLFPSAIAGNLVNLKDLTIERCKEMVKVIDNDDEINRESRCPLLLFPSLEYLTLDSLPKLESFCKWRCVIELPMLDYVHIDKCPRMKVFTMGSLISTPKLKNIYIENQIKDVGDLNEYMTLHS